MNIKSLLIGSAAAMVAVSGAQAADAIVVEPEPVEYVRVCDAYGTGFFFIPGTETCIRFSGYIRSAYAKAYTDVYTTGTNVNSLGTIVNYTPTVRTEFDQAWWINRARLNVDTRNETEWGTLRGLFRLESDGNGNESVRGDVAMLSLAGFRVGFIGDNYWSTNHGFGGVNADEAVLGYGGFYGFGDATAFDYTFASEGFSLTVGVEDLNGDADYGFITQRNDFNGTPNIVGGSGYANFYAGFNYTADFGHVAFTAAHDSASQEITTAGLQADRGNWAYKVSASLDLSEFIPGGSIWGWYLNDGDAVTSYVYSPLHTNAESIWGVAFNANLTDEIEFYANYWDAEGGNVVTNSTTGVSAHKEGDAYQWAVGLNWFPAAAPGFSIRTAYLNGEAKDVLGSAGAAAAGNAYGFTTSDVDYDGFEVILRRNF